MVFLEFISDKTLNIAFAITHFVIMIVLLVTYPIYRKVYLRTMIMGHGVMALAIILLTMRNLVPNFISIIIANTFLVGGSYLVMVGFLQMAELKPVIKLYAILLIIFSGIHVVFTYINPNVTYRIINYGVFLIIGIVMLLVSLFNKIRVEHKVSLIVISIAYLIDMLNNFSRIINVIWLEEVVALFRGSGILKIYIILSILIAMIRIVTILMSNTTDLVEV